MKPLEKHQQELNYRHNIQDGLEVQLVFDSLLGMAYSRVEDHKNKVKFDALAPEGIHPRESFEHPYIYQVPSSLKQIAGVTHWEGMGDE